MKRSVLSKVIGAGIISFNLAMLPLVLPVSAQTSTTSSSANTGSNSNSSGATGTSNIPDPNINPKTSTTTSNSSNTGTSTTSNEANMGSGTAPGGSTSGNSTAPGNTTAETTNAPSSSTSNNSSAPGESNTATGTTPSQPANSTKSESPSLGWLGLLGLLGLASLFRRPARVSTDNRQLQARSNANDHIEQGLAGAGEGIGNFFDELKTDVNDFKERRAKAKETKEIKNALGRPSNRVILDKQDTVILNVGDLITNQAIEQAKAADMLDVLLDSVDEQKPEIENDDRIAPVPGEASLEEQETTTNNHRN